MRKHIHLHNMNLMDIEPIDVSSKISVFDGFATLSINIGTTQISLFLANEDDAKEARNRLAGAVQEIEVA